jgi:hypothetical protein
MPILKKEFKSNHPKAGNPMKTKSLVVTLAASLFLLNLCVSSPAHGGRIDVVVDHGVDQEAEAKAKATVDAIFDFFQRTYGIGLQEDIRIKLSCDKLNYKKAIKDWHGVSESQASYEASSTAGLARKGDLIIDLGDIRDTKWQLFVVCHEIVHFYQNQEGGKKHGQLRWMSEGVANVIAAHIMETVSGQTAGTFKKYWLEKIKRAGNYPRLEYLHSPNQISVYLGYDTASLAVLTLVEWRGYPALFAYFRNLKDTSPEDAFYRAFGTRLSDFEKGFKPF